MEKLKTTQFGSKIQFNIIYIMRTKVDSGGIWRNAVVIALVTERCDAIMARYAGSGFQHSGSHRAGS
ncbi:hypothetical protein AFK67_09890 [Cronobacter dublinensis subsp. dublinensis LMG 23823]|nr:hypothetical protein AFK67_09890 [Cronobacter dublinensis subsp. dublinensis LMG 23823]